MPRWGQPQVTVGPLWKATTYHKELPGLNRTTQHIHKRFGDMFNLSECNLGFVLLHLTMGNSISTITTALVEVVFATLTLFAAPVEQSLSGSSGWHSSCLACSAEILLHLQPRWPRRFQSRYMTAGSRWNSCSLGKCLKETKWGERKNQWYLQLRFPTHLHFL